MVLAKDQSVEIPGKGANRCTRHTNSMSCNISGSITASTQHDRLSELHMASHLS